MVNVLYIVLVPVIKSYKIWIGDIMVTDSE